MTALPVDWLAQIDSKRGASHRAKARYHETRDSYKGEEPRSMVTLSVTSYKVKVLNAHAQNSLTLLHRYKRFSGKFKV